MDTPLEKVLLTATAVFLVRDGQVLLARKKRKIGKDCWNGYGGGVEDGETIPEAAAREFSEESGGATVAPAALRKIAIVDFHNTKSDGEMFVCRVHCFTAEELTGTVRETDEMGEPTWFPIGDLPLDEMMPADRDWLPLALSGKKVVARAYLSPFQREKLRSTEVRIMEEFPEEI